MGNEPNIWSADGDDDGIMFLDDASVELIEEPQPRGGGGDLENADTRVWIRPHRWQGSAWP